MRKTVFFTIGVVFLVGLFGCSNKVQVSGKVVFEDGTPLTAGTVVFDNGREQAKGAISENGTYRLSSMANHDGIPPGEYGVYITGALGFRGPVTMQPGTVPRPDDLIDAKFTSKATSELTCAIKGATVFDIVVTPPEK
ncbi:MAG: carboxypeptidase-like regulatory domain-containing protein [Planctomycetaceae bacterium]|nr:carboxypeptidase-like regulatory domain-containing protein [Planctomycetaceae bacterium]